jgi:hypothetical protein
MPRSALQRADTQLFLLAFLVGWQAALIYKLTGTISHARHETRALRAARNDALDLLHERDVRDSTVAAANGNGAGFVAPEHGPAERAPER